MVGDGIELRRKTVTKLSARWLCRREQIDQLLEILYCTPGRDFTFVYGQSDTGKTSVVRACLSACDTCVAYLGPLELRGLSSQVRSHIINGWMRALGKDPLKVDSYMDAQAAITALDVGSLRLVAVVDWTDATTDREHLPAVVDLVRGVARPIHVIVVSPEPLGALCLAEPPVPEAPWLTVEFPPYSQDEVITILASQRPADIPAPLYHSFLNRFVKPASHAALSLSDTRAILLELKPHLQAAHSRARPGAPHAHVLLDMQSRSRGACDRAARCRRPAPADIGHFDFSSPPTSDLHTAQAAAAQQSPDTVSLDIPYLSKFLLLAAYLAGNNQPTADRSVFVPAGAGRKARRRDVRATDRQAEAAQEQATSSGQVFGLERWLQIFWKLVEFDEAENESQHRSGQEEQSLLHEMQSASVLHQIRHLIGVRLITHVSGEILSSAKFCSNVTQDLAEGIAKNVKAELSKYLVYV